VASNGPLTVGDERVAHADRWPDGPDAPSTRTLIAPREGSPLSLSLIELTSGVTAQLGSDPAVHELVYVLEGSVALAHGGARHEIEAESAFLHDGADGPGTIHGGDAGARLAVFGAASTCDEHAAVGERRVAVALDLSDAGSATGSRSFQVMLGPQNACCRATMFVGVVPPGAAPWHFHQYDEIVYLLDGEAAYHQAGGPQQMRPGSAVRIPPRTVHINENVSAGEMRVLGVFTPAGSPSAAYLAPAPTGA
jgi:quercetin dioxygenase-like cupin family protein